MQASEHDAPGSSQREHEFSDLEERISEAEVPLDDESLLEMESHVQADEPPVARRSQPPALQSVPSEYEEVAHAEVTHDLVSDEAQTHERISYFEQAQAEAYRQNPISAFAEEHAAALAKAHGQSRYELAWADWDRQFEQFGHAPVIASALEPVAAKRSRLLVPGVALAALVVLGGAAYQLVIAPGQQEAAATAAAPQAKEPQPVVEAQAAGGGEAAERASDEAIARADEAARAAQGTPTTEQVNPTRAAEEPQARVAPATDEESPEARRERIREEKRAARREARHRRRDEKRAAELAGGRESGGTSVISAKGASAPAAATADEEESEDAEGETVIEPEPVKKPKKKAAARAEKSGKDSDSDDPLYGLE